MDNTQYIWQELKPYAKKLDLKKKDILIEEGRIGKQLYYVNEGCLRSWFNHDGKDVSFQFFLEGQFVSSFESLMFREPSPYTIESILPSVVYAMPVDTFKAKIQSSHELKDAAFQIIADRLRHYQRLFLSRIKDTPQERYQELIAQQPELIRMIPQHYIASYLGITSVSLSRIRCRKTDN
ncbi:Crp/Fnr family transcriptional regulator [Vibrio sp. JC009]|uniref:Crp/Fnr family transcriptional regulator n=1 Tax=Vibrio sp. JC009 TaxID=2912314 RepID=UPI0023B132A6|nr:Crp/Fnr family transcriptional regulator [Vibrio sp. JC009]WED24612.1 Crp/Fnr family transcriptional regulator [Vibrio sp. JC009]